MIALRLFAPYVAAIAGLVVLQPLRANAEWWHRGPVDYEECADAADKSATKEQKAAALTECNAKFAGRRKPGGGYTYYDFMLQAGKEPVVEASIVKDIGTVWEQQLPHRVRELAAFVEEDAGNRETLEQQLSFAIKTAPKLTIQGGTTEVLRGIIARGLGLR